ncbi:inactive serine protease 39-like [Pteronotus mesoamericanus]|uniref:inactive serine protease 39-like n=1 Tax=Pteronotus mesoamericanus TaxID=1884717 RepID=UPI0023EDCF90|nr:inactive serine protease 39-like [Pteronotus parnellii mesoamericanus]
MASAWARGAGPGRRTALSLAVALLWLWPPLRAQRRGATATPTTTVNTSAGCGRPVGSGKILGGSDAPDQRWPWQASLLYHGAHLCGAALVDALWVVSAAHCFQKSHHPGDYRVLLGYHKLHEATPHTLQMAVNRVIVHRDFNKNHYMANDVALLQLRQPVTFTAHVLPACLPGPRVTLPPRTACWITGWGMVTEDTLLPRPFQLQEAQVSVLERRICQMLYPSNSQYGVHDDALCAGTMTDNKSICRGPASPTFGLDPEKLPGGQESGRPAAPTPGRFCSPLAPAEVGGCPPPLCVLHTGRSASVMKQEGDSGGPLSCQLNDTWFVLGLASWSLPCRTPVSPSVFTSLSHFSGWIRQQQSAAPPPARPPHQPAVGPSNPAPGTGHRPRSRAALLLSQAFPLLMLLPPPGAP